MCGICIDVSDNIYIVDSHRVLRLDSSGHHVTTIAGFDEPSEVKECYNISINRAEDAILIADMANERVAMMRLTSL